VSSSITWNYAVKQPLSNGDNHSFLASSYQNLFAIKECWMTLRPSYMLDEAMVTAAFGVMMTSFLPWLPAVELDKRWRELCCNNQYDKMKERPTFQIPD
jgi:hypothetical protein